MQKGDDNLIYDTIKELCKKKGLSVSSVEKEAGLSNGAISKWNDSSPTVDKLNAVAKVLNVKVDCLLS
jgi:transcriptional regulator with XRE-family HTH domain